jgi:hypothetical protein
MNSFVVGVVELLSFAGAKLILGFLSSEFGLCSSKPGWNIEAEIVDWGRLVGVL